MLALLSLAAALAQSVNVNVMPLRDVLPPQVMYYLSNPGQYFNITVQNPSTEAQQIFFGAELRQVTPASGLEVVVPAKTMPRQPIEVGAGATRVLTAAEMRTMFNHVRSSDVSMPSNLFSDVTSGSFGNLPEGTYEIIINAYQWNPNTPTPVLISNPALSRTMFRVCYQAKAPEWLMPVSTGDFENRDIATLVNQTPILTWTAPQVNCDPKPRNYTYDLKIVQQMPLQDPLEAIERNPVVYQVTGLTVAQCMLPASIVNGLSPFETYVAQVTARSNATQIGALDYINIQNDGRSQLRLFRIKDYSSSSPDGRVTFAPPVVSDPMMAAGGDTLSAQRSVTIDWKAPVSDNPSVLPVTFSYELKAVEAVKDMDLSSEAARRSLMESQPALYEAKNLRTLSHDLPAETFAKAKGSMDVLVQVTARPDTIAGSHRKYIFTDDGRSAPVRFTVGKGGIRIVGLGADGDAPDSLYVFNNPRITSPYFAPDGGARKLFVGDALNLNWERPRYYSGDGVRQDTIRFSYDVELYAAREYKDREEMLKQKPIYTNRNLTQRSDSIGWSVLGEKVAKGDYLFLRVVPKSLNEESIHFLNDSLNTFDAAMAERISHNFFKCRNQIDIENTNPTARSADDLRGSEVMVGEYKLILDGDLKAVEGKPGHFSGNGHVVWSPLLLTWKLAVEFSDIAINTEDQVYEGVVETWGGKEGVKMRSSEVVDKLFSDWGIDNLIGDTGLPYADRLQEEANGKIRGLADDLPEIAEYYQDFQKGKAFVSNLLKGNLEDVTFPLEIPEEYNTTPVGLTINKMKFAPTFATMDIFGTCVVPESEVTQKQILVFGAPRLCISPSSLIPEGGMVALLKDFVIEEKKTGFECTFKAPTDVIEPADGCFVAWSDNKFVGLTLDVDMKMPEDLKKVDSSGKPTEESPMLHIKTTLSSWDDFLVEANLDEFEHVDLPGFTFGASTVVVDLSATRNGDGMVFPKEDFDRAKAGISTGQDELWEGLFIKKINMRFPESIKIGNGDDPMSFTMENMFIDRSGITLDAGLKNIIDYSTGKEGEIDGFKYTLDHLYISIIQNNFNKFYFDGQLNIPLFKGTVYYTCDIYNQSYTQKGTGKGYAYVFKTTQIEDLDFDFMLGELKLDHRLTYFLIEALPDASGELKTNVELCVGGGVTVAGAKTVNKKLAKLPFDLSLPQLKFCNMRLANGKRFESVYADSLQKRDRAATEVIVDAVAEGSYGWWNEAKDIELCGGKLVLNFGQWGAIAGEFEEIKATAEESFKSGMGDKSEKKNEDYKKDMASYKEKKGEDKDKSDDGTSFSGPSLKVSLDLYIGHKKPGGATKWHLYLGEPDHDKRCEFTLVDFKTKIVSVAIGANAYFCLGNELPNNGQLPPIPEKVRRFLDGGEKGGVKSDNISEANDARSKACTDFLANAKTSGGVMLGASVWGYVKVDLGLFYGDMGATAGFDVSIRHLKGNNTCMNLGKAPGIDGWYGEGQLYAYLYAKFGLRINLGFFKKKLDLFNAGIGGVLKCGMPNPNYFTGKARVKVELLGGLVKLNKKFSFECGDVCEMFYGNALDDYVLFESCNIGLKSWDEAEKAKISWDIQSNPIVMTQADLNVPIRVVDPTQLNRLQNHSSGDGKSEETLKDLASRQFRFKMDASLPPTLTEYSSLSDAKANRNGVVYEMTHHIYKEKVTLSVDQLHRNKYYKVTISGYAQEFYNGSWRNPETYDTLKHKYVAQAWKQTKEFYFATNNEEMSFKDDEDLYPHVKVMYPNQGKPGNREDMMFNYSANGKSYSYNYTPAYWEDVKQPIISLARPMKGKAYQKGRLKWYLYSNGKLLSTRENQWIETNSYSILTPQSGFANVPETNNADYIIRLRYEWTETKTSPATWVVARTYNVWGTSAKQVRTKAMKDNGINAYGRVLNKKVEVSEAGLMNVNDNDTVGTGRRKFIVTVYERKAGKVTREFVKDLLALKVTVTKQGVTGDALYDKPLYYCSKFMATRLDKITYDGQNLEMNDDQLLITSANQRGGFVPYYNTENPFIYLSYMSRMFFIGGHKFVSAKKNLNLTVQSTQSLWLETPYGSWRDGILKNRYIGHIRDGRKSIEFALTMGTYRFENELGTAYPLYSDHSGGYTQWLGNSSSLFDGHKLTEEAYARVFAEVYNIAEDMHNNIIRRVGSQIYYSKSSMRDWLASYAGSKEQTYDDAESGVYAFVPRYQYGVVWNAASRCGLNISKTIEMDKASNKYRHVRIRADKGDFLGRTLYFAYADKDHKKYVDDDYKSQSQVLQFNAWKALRNNNMRLYFKRYRVNAWDYKNRQWTVYPLQYSEKRFTNTYNDLLKNLVVKYNIPLRGH